MDELSQARAELALLEEQARRLFKEFLHVRAAVGTQRTKIDELIRTRPTAFNLLPTEILLSILDLDVHAEDLDQCPERKYQLAGVCRRWKNIIFDSPSLWTTIHVAISSASSVMTHLERSRGALLDIVIETPLRSRSKHLALVPSLDIVSSLTHRWHSLSIAHLCDDDYRSISPTLTEFIIKRINHLQFPSLKYITISYCDTPMDFLSPASAPALEHLELDGFLAECTDFPSVTALKTLDLGSGGPMDSSSFPYPISTQALTKLSLSDSAAAFSAQPNSIHIPSLKMLEISCVPKPRQFVNAIVVPNLERFAYTSFIGDDPPSVVLRGFRSKFTNVRHLSFYHAKTRSTDADAIALCEAFPGVRHVELRTNQPSHLFDPTLSNVCARRPIDLWTELESLTLWALHSKWLEPNQFSAWLVDRQALAPRKLYVKLIHSGYNALDKSIDFEFTGLYEVLKENCVLELDNITLKLPEVHLHMPANSWLRVVSTLFPYARLYSLYMYLAFAVPNNGTYG